MSSPLNSNNREGEAGYREVVTRIEEKGRFAREPGVVNSRRLFERLSLQPVAPVIHIAGTNGKGSTAMYTSALLAEAGYRVGLFTSPHLFSYTERIAVVEGAGARKTEISEEDFARLGAQMLQAAEEITCTLFDILLMIAVSYFKERGCDCLILEAGLGGRLDSTTAVPAVPRVSCITSIGLDHMAVLGEDIRSIAAEKAGIIRPGTEVVLGEMEDEAARVIIERCRTLEVPYVQAASPEREPEAEAGYQARNMAVAAAVCTVFGIPVSAEDVSRLPDLVRPPRRLEVLCESPYVLADAAHNGQAVKALFQTLTRRFSGEPFWGVVSMLQEREPEQVFSPALPYLERVFVVPVRDGRGMKPEKLAGFFSERGIAAELCEDEGDVKKLLAGARDSSRRVIVFGSFYLMQRMEELRSGKRGEP